ncbi:MAG: DJ-1/PfpI family protein [Peptococcaceae bacterium]|nr:DJ-1/PfpI family protein [Peptococcaceae bacterium]
MYRVGIFVFHNVELLDFAGPFEVFSVTSELNDFKLFQVFTISNDGEPVTSVNGLKTIPDYSFNSHPVIDILIIPGGVGTKSEMEKGDVLEWLMNSEKQAKMIISVCSGARLLGKIGLLDGKECTTHHEVMEHLKVIAPKAIINPDVKFVDNGKILTSAGISAGIDLSLYVVEKLYGAEIANKTKCYMEYGDWTSVL